MSCAAWFLSPPGVAAEERFETIARLGVFLFLERNLREIVLRFAELRIEL